MPTPLEECTQRIKYDYDPDTGILETTLYEVKAGKQRVILTDTITDPAKVGEMLVLLRKMEPWVP